MGRLRRAPWPGNVRNALSRPARLRPANMGFVLTLSGIAGLLAQYRGEELLRSKRLVLAWGSVVGFSAL